MNINELSSYNLADAIKFHSELNPRLWDDREHLHPQIRAKLLDIARDFQEFLGVSNLELEDITISGSNAAYTYTPHSDIDLHLVVKMPEDNNEVYQELFNAKKYQYNDMHNIKVGGADVELYVQPADQSPVSLGEYSVLHNQWLQVPKKAKADINQTLVRNKYQTLAAQIESALKQSDSTKITALTDKIKKMRQTGLAKNGEFGPENLAFKMLRTQGLIDRLHKAKNAARDAELSIDETQKKFRYGFASSQLDEVGMTPDGVSPSTRMFFDDDTDKSELESTLHKFADQIVDELDIKNIPEIIFHHGTDWTKSTGSFGQYSPDNNTLQLAVSGRHILDIIRTMAHELTHCKQGEIGDFPDWAGETGSPWEDEANAMAGRILRGFANERPELFADVKLEEASGYIPTRAQAKDKRFSTALTVDIKPGQTGREANKLNLQTDAQGKPALLMKTKNLRESTELPTQEKLDKKLSELVTLVRKSQHENPERYGSVAACIIDGPDRETSAMNTANKDGTSRHAEFNVIASHLKRFKTIGPNAILITTLSPCCHDLKDRQGPDCTNVIEKHGIKNVWAGYQDPAQHPEHDFPFSMQVTNNPDIFETCKNLYQGFSSRHLARQLAEQLREFKEPPVEDELGNQAVTGPETPPTMPAGTVRVDVSDVYDWYKLGQHISNMKGLGKHDFGSGPPSSIISFGDEETEHKFIKDLEATGLDVTDIDPADPKQPAGMRKIKTDPTYNVSEDIVESLRQEFALLEDEYISEVKMSTANLRQLAAQTGALAGMEFEMIVPNTETDVEPEYEPDYDQDQRARSFSDVRDFFHDGDYNGRRAVDDLISELAEEYEEWMQEQSAEQWNRDGVDYIRDFVEVNDLFDRDEAMAQARDEVISANPDLPQESEDFTQLLSARLDELQEQFVLEAFEDQGRIYNDAFEAFAEEQREEYDERSFLDDKYPTMSDIQNNFDISWPYYYDINDGQDGEMDIDQVADDFSNSIGKPVNASRSYHGARREAGHYVVEPDGSLEGDNPGDGGLEFVSPPMPIDEMMSDLNKVKAWAGREGCYTNDSTGLHINISVPDYSLEKLDYVKLALLMGDEYVLDLFGRSGNTYAKAATDKIRDALKRNPDLAPVMMDKMRDHMEDLATKAIHSGTTDKYTSINTKTGYIEFRSPGGDWLDANFDKIENTLLRFTVALSAAIDPQAYRQEYLKKLYKLLESSQDKGGLDVVQLFSNYSAGDLDKAALIRQVRQKQLARNVEKGKVTGKMWWSVARPGYFASVEVVAASKEEAIEKGKQEYPDWRNARDMTATPLRPYQEPQTPEEAGPTLNGRPSNPDGNWIIVDRRAPTTPVYRFMAASDRDALLVLRQWIEANRGSGVEWNFAPDANQRMGQPVAQQQSAQDQTGNWGIWIRSANRFARMPNTIVADNVLRRFPGRDTALQWIERTRAENPQMRTDIEVREIEPSTVTTSEPAAGGNPAYTMTRPAEPGSNINRLSQTDIENRLGWPDQTGDANYEVVDRRTQQPVFKFIANTDQDAARKYSQYLDVLMLPHETEDYEFREIGTPIPGSTLDLQRQRAAQAPRTLTVPGQPQQQFTGEWKIVGPDGREIHRFGGIGNAQADANRVAIQWLQRNPRHMQDGVEVVPVMG